MWLAGTGSDRRQLAAMSEKAQAAGFLTIDANAEVATYHSKAMPVILTDPAEWDLWLSDAPWAEVRHLQRPPA